MNRVQRIINYGVSNEHPMYDKMYAAKSLSDAIKIHIDWWVSHEDYDEQFENLATERTGKTLERRMRDHLAALAQDYRTKK